MSNYRHGDVYLISTESIPEKVTAVKTNVLAYGEVTGHRHQVLNGEVFADKNGQLFLHASADTELHHLDEAQKEADHKPLQIDEGDYKVVIQEEYTPEGWKQVID